MKRTPRPATDTPVSSFTGAIDQCIKKITRFVSGLTSDERNWTPAGIKNSLSWILIHLTAELWCCHSAVTGIHLPFNPAAEGLAWGGIRGLEFDEKGRLPSPPEEDPTKHLYEAWEAIKTVLDGKDSSWEQREIYSDAKMRTAWWFLTKSLCDIAYHTGQASALRKLIAAERKRSKR